MIEFNLLGKTRPRSFNQLVGMLDQTARKFISEKELAEIEKQTQSSDMCSKDFVLHEGRICTFGGSTEILPIKKHLEYGIYQEIKAVNPNNSISA